MSSCLLNRCWFLCVQRLTVVLIEWLRIVLQLGMLSLLFCFSFSRYCPDYCFYVWLWLNGDQISKTYNIFFLFGEESRFLEFVYKMFVTFESSFKGRPFNLLDVGLIFFERRYLITERLAAAVSLILKDLVLEILNLLFIVVFNCWNCSLQLDHTINNLVKTFC